jgi:NDP-sugar pyrophosphorylase family protein
VEQGWNRTIDWMPAHQAHCKPELYTYEVHMKAVILAGGRGTRLAPYTMVLPKPLVPVGDIPILEILLRQLIAAGITDVTLSIGHLADLIRAFFTHHTRLTSRLDLHFVVEEEPKGTAGPLTQVPGLAETFLVMNGDILTTLDFHKLIAFHREQRAILTIAGHRKKVTIDLGVMQLDPAGCRVLGYIEKPDQEYPVSMGIYVYEPRALDYIPRGRYFDFPSLVLTLLAQKEKVACYRSDDIWLDIGRPADYENAREVFEQRREEFRLADLEDPDK